MFCTCRVTHLWVSLQLLLSAKAALQNIFIPLNHDKMGECQLVYAFNDDNILEGSRTGTVLQLGSAQATTSKAKASISYGYPDLSNSIVMG